MPKLNRKEIILQSRKVQWEEMEVMTFWKGRGQTQEEESIFKLKMRKFLQRMDKIWFFQMEAQ